jgi:hypothetical protein
MKEAMSVLSLTTGKESGHDDGTRVYPLNKTGLLHMNQDQQRQIHRRSQQRVQQEKRLVQMAKTLLTNRASVSN